MRELEAFDPELAKRPMIVGISKMDLAETRERADEVKAGLEARGLEVFPFSAATREGIDAVLTRLEQLLLEHPPEHRREGKKFVGPQDRPAAHGDGKPAPAHEHDE